jgi:hypothetical protein
LNDTTSPVDTSARTSLKRIASLDFARGLAIFLMTFFHCFYHVYDHTWFVNEPEKILTYPKIVVGIMAVLIFLGTWNTFFLLVSSAVNTLAMVRSTKRRSSPSQVLFKNILTALFLMVADHLIEGWGWYGYLGNGMRTGNWGAFEGIWHSFFGIATLEIIAWSLIITSIINFFLLRKNGYENYKRNMVIYAVLSSVIIISTQFVHNAVDTLVVSGWAGGEAGVVNHSFVTWFFVRIGGALEPIFPVLATGFIGAMIGLAVSRPKPSKKLVTWGSIFALICVTAGVILLIVGRPFNIYTRPLIHIYLIQLGGEIAILMLMFRLVEFRSRGEKFANKRVVRYLRRWSMVALTIYALELYDILPKWTLNLTAGRITGLNFFEKVLGYGDLKWGFLVAIYCMLWYELLLWLWGKANYKFAFEWFMLRFQSIATKTVTDRLNVELMLDRVEWVNYGEYPVIWLQKIKEKTGNVYNSIFRK